MTIVGVGALTVALWVALMMAIWWPFIVPVERGLAEAHERGTMVDAPELVVVLPVVLLVVAYEVARRVWRRWGNWDRSGAGGSSTHGSGRAY